MIAERVAEALNRAVDACEPLGGSASVRHFRVQQGFHSFFVKSGGAEVAEEALGLRALAEAGARVPRVAHASDDLLILEWIETEFPMPPYWPALGRELAELHRRPHDTFGFETDNHLGGTPQANPVAGGRWADYFWTHRLAPLVARTGWDAPNLKELTLDRLASVDEPPSLVHGDLWNGNVLCGPHQRGVLIDSAPYRGHREVDLAMTELFGGFAPKFYAAYDEVYPRRPGYAERRSVYNLYHLLNHWLLFGASYRIACERALAQITRARA